MNSTYLSKYCLHQFHLSPKILFWCKLYLCNKSSGIHVFLLLYQFCLNDFFHDEIFCLLVSLYLYYFFICVTIFNIIVTTLSILFAAFLYKVKKTFWSKNVWSGFFNIKKRCLNPVIIYVLLKKKLTLNVLPDTVACAVILATRTVDILDACDGRQPLEACVGEIWHVHQLPWHGTSREKALTPL